MILKSFTYLLVDFLTIIVCFVASFDQRIKFNKHFGSFIKASILAAIPFIAWDIFFTVKGIWWFNENYTLGLTILHLPFEEWLFFICIPFSCIFTYFLLDHYYSWKWTVPLNSFIYILSTIVLLSASVLCYQKIYTFVTAIAALTVLFFLHVIMKVQWIAQASVSFGILMLGFFPVNGILTGTGLESPVVNYHPDHIIGLRMLTIPVEDAVYGYAQFLLVLFLFKHFQTRKTHAK